MSQQKEKEKHPRGFLWSFLPPLLPSLRVFPQLLAARLQLGLPLLGYPRLGAATRGHPVEDGLRNRSLKVAREPGPSPTRVNAQLAVLLACSEPKQLAKERHALLADGPCGLKHRRTEQVVSAPEALVVLLMLPQTVRVGRAFQSFEKELVTATSTAKAFESFQQGMVTSPGRRPEHSPGRQQTLLCEPKQQVPEPVVSNDDVRVRFAARGVVAAFVKGLRAKRSCPGGTARL